jgi:hypothetical protein
VRHPGTEQEELIAQDDRIDTRSGGDRGAGGLGDRVLRRPGRRDGSVARLPLAPQPHATPLVADAFGAAFWVAVGLIAAGLALTLLLPRTKPEQQIEQTAEVAGDEHVARLPPRFLSFGRP